MDNVGHGGGLIAGAALGWGLAPRWMVQREVAVESGVSYLPEDEEEYGARATAAPRGGP